MNQQTYVRITSLLRSRTNSTIYELHEAHEAHGATRAEP